MNSNRWVIVWLICGISMVYFQVIIGGVTRLTGSGLSITKWEIVTGTIPPMNEGQWEREFEEYKRTPQYEKINRGMSLKAFKFIYFWEYIHRLWARLMGFVFIIPFCIFAFQKRLNKPLAKDLGIVILLSILAASFGWIMVASGLINRPWVNAYKLSIHLCIGISVFGYLLWGTLKFVFRGYKANSPPPPKVWIPMTLFGLLVIQLFAGGIMSGMKAALFYPSWPDIGGHMLPPELSNLENWSWNNFYNYDEGSFAYAFIQFFHRMIGYLICIISFIYLLYYRVYNYFHPAGKWFVVFCFLVIIQVILGIFTLIGSVGRIPVLLGVLHQGVAVLLLGSLICHSYFSKYHSQNVT